MDARVGDIVTLFWSRNQMRFVGERFSGKAGFWNQPVTCQWQAFSSNVAA
jgi:hypothetical protein